MEEKPDLDEFITEQKKIHQEAMKDLGIEVPESTGMDVGGTSSSSSGNWIPAKATLGEYFTPKMSRPTKAPPTPPVPRKNPPFYQMAKTKPAPWASAPRPPKEPPPKAAPKIKTAPKQKHLLSILQAAL